MAMNPMQKKARTSFLLGMLLSLVIAGFIIVFLIMQIGNLKKEQAAIKYKDVYVVGQEIASGEAVLPKIQLQKVEASTIPNNAIDNLNYGTYISDLTTSKINLEFGTVLTTEMLNIDGKVDTADTRMQEYNMLILPTQLEQGQTVDVRLRLPTGEDYIVVSKKYVEQTDANTIWMKVSEDEILTMSNAIVEAYKIEGSYLYVTTYIDAGMQEAVTPTYVVSNSIMNLMDADPNLTAEARAGLAKRYSELARAQRNNIINPTLQQFADEGLSNVQGKVEEEIQKQKSARQEYIETMGL